MSRLKERYKNEIRQKLNETFGYKNPMLVPKLKKVVINMGIGEAVKDKGILQDHIAEMALISGQQPVVTKAKKSVANFKLREGQAVGIKVTLRGTRMFEFTDRFLRVDVPRIRDFRGFNAPKGDTKGCYSLGLNDQEIFHGLNLDKIKRQQGMNITFVTSARSDKETEELLRLLGMPFKEERKS